MNRQSDYPLLPKSNKPRTRTANRFTRQARHDERTEHNFDVDNSVSHERTEYGPDTSDFIKKSAKKIRQIPINETQPIENSYSKFL